jgi:serine/threonine protein kinase
VTAPRLGELLLAAGVADAARVDAAIKGQQRAAAQGDFRRLGELVVEWLRLPVPVVRGLLRQQGLELVRCELCEARFAAILPFQGLRPCLRCARRLGVAPEDGPLATEDLVADPGAETAIAAWRSTRNRRFLRYELLGEVGRGGMGVIHKAWDAQHQRNVALKFLTGAASLTPEDVRRFRREARSIAALRHEHILKAYGVEEAGDITALVLEHVPGVTLDVLVEKGVLGPRNVVTVCAKVARALHHAHKAGVVHRDVKPGNVVVTPDGRPYLIDFGIAKAGAESQSLTLEGEVVGSLAYMAPEYLTRGAEGVSPRCDVYSLGVVLYELLTGGKHPFGDGDDQQLMMKLLKESPVPVATASPTLPPTLGAIIDRAIRKDPAHRHPTAEALAQDLEAFAASGA